MVIIFTKNPNPRINYTCELIFGQVMGIPHEVTDDQDKFDQSKKTKINYSTKALASTLQVLPSGLLNETELVKISVPLGEWSNLPTLFVNENKDIPFDVFSAVFYLVCRYEEYLPFDADEHKRFEADQSIAGKHNFLHLPVVDLWCQQLAKKIGVLAECKNLNPDNYNFTLSIDIDDAWVYKHRGVNRTLRKLFKNFFLLNFKEFSSILRVLSNRTEDPGDSFDFLRKVQRKLKNKIEFFILCRHSGSYDGSVSLKNRHMKELLRSLDSKNPLGLHPSYDSNKSFRMLKKECSELSSIVNHPIIKGRQHYLILSLPDTYRNLLKLGIKEDYTMGYASKTGFRAGIARPFYFYDLYAEKQSELKIFPFQVMDRTLQQYMAISPAEAEKEMNYYSETIESVGGNFCALWHNTSLTETSEWTGWIKVFEAMINFNLEK